MSTRRRRALTAVDFNTVEFAVIESFASGDPAVIITAEQLILEDLGDSKLQVTIVQVTVMHAADGPTAEAITAAANKTAFLKRVAEELEAEVAFGVLPSTVVVVVTTLPTSPSVMLSPPPAPPPDMNGQSTDEKDDTFSIATVVGAIVGAVAVVAAAILATIAVADAQRARRARREETITASIASPSYVWDDDMRT